MVETNMDDIKTPIPLKRKIIAKSVEFLFNSIASNGINYPSAKKIARWSIPYMLYII